jgi:hypothetical protein
VSVGTSRRKWSGVAEDHRPAELREPVEHRRRVVAALCDVAEHDGIVDAEPCELAEDGVERLHVPVDVREEGVRHDAITLST